jgi:hypothetical protein
MLHVQEIIMKRGFNIIALWNKGFAEEMKSRVPLSCGKMIYYAQINEEETLVDTVTKVYKAADKYRVVACFAGGEAGVDLADALSERLSLCANGT